jgi:hypothetical protein
MKTLRLKVTRRQHGTLFINIPDDFDSERVWEDPHFLKIVKLADTTLSEEEWFTQLNECGVISSCTASEDDKEKYKAFTLV